MNSRLLRVEAPHFVAGAVWQRGPDGWRCTEHVAPILAWIRGKQAADVLRYLTRKGWRFTWI